MTATITIAADLEALADAWENARNANLPSWIANAHPGALTGIDLTKVSTGHLADLYPNIWNWGPHGDTYAAQITRIDDLLTLARHDGGADHAFVADIYTALDSMNDIADDHNIIGDLTTHAYATGHPIRGNTIFYGIDLNSDAGQYPAILVNHPIWAGNTNAQANCEEFLYNLTLLTVHRDYFESLTDPRVHAALNDYTAFCDAWKIPA